jgi:hypothetical protein
VLPTGLPSLAPLSVVSDISGAALTLLLALAFGIDIFRPPSFATSEVFKLKLSWFKPPSVSCAFATTGVCDALEGDEDAGARAARKLLPLI